MIFTIAALILGATAVASMFPASAQPPTYIVVPAPEPPAARGSVSLPLLLLLLAVVVAIALL